MQELKIQDGGGQDFLIQTLSTMLALINAHADCSYTPSPPPDWDKGHIKNW